MVTSNDMRRFIESREYINLLDMVVSNLKLKVIDETPPSQMFNIDADSINKSNIELDKLLRVCSDSSNELVRYVDAKLLKISDDIDEYNHDDDKDVITETLLFYKTFLIGYAIELFL